MIHKEFILTRLSLVGLEVNGGDPAYETNFQSHSPVSRVTIPMMMVNNPKITIAVNKLQRIISAFDITSSPRTKLPPGISGTPPCIECFFFLLFQIKSYLIYIFESVSEGSS